MGWTSTKLGSMFLLKDTTQWPRWGSNPRPSVSSQALYIALPPNICYRYQSYGWYGILYSPPRKQGARECIIDMYKIK